MTHVFYDNVRETAVTEGTGNIAMDGPSGAIPTAVVGRRFSDVLSTGDTFNYVIQHRTVNEWEAGIGSWAIGGSLSRDLVQASSNGNAPVNFSAGTKVVYIGPTAAIRNFFAGLVNIVNSNAIAGHDNTGEIAAARTSAGLNTPVFAPGAAGVAGAWGVKDITTLDFAADGKGEGTAFSLSQGTTSNPSETSAPVLYIEKTTQGDPTNINDHGGIDIRVKKTGGTNNTYGFYVAADNAGGTGIVTPMFCVIKGSNPSATYVTGSRVFVNKAVPMSVGIVTGMDVLMYDTSGEDNGWMDSNAAGSTTGIALQNGNGRATFGLRVETGAPGNGFYTGILVDQDSVLPSSFDGHADAIRVKGGNSAPFSYGGVWLESGYFDYGLNLVGPTYANSCAIVLSKDNKIVFGTSTAASSYVTWTSADLFNINQGKLAINGTQVLQARITGWTTPTGTPTRTGFDTASATATDVAQAVMALIQDLKTHGVLGT